MRRFYLEELEGDTLVLEGPEAHHARNVVKLSVGDFLTTFDGKGNERTCKVDSVNRHHLDLIPSDASKAIDRRPNKKVEAAVVFPKSRSRDFLLEKLVELGVRAIHPLTDKRGVGAPDPDRMRQQALVALKQCGINHLPRIHEPQPLVTFLENNPTAILLDGEGNKETPPNDPALFIVGPEGGFDPESIKNFKGTRWSLGASVLRTETACLTAMARLAI